LELAARYGGEEFDVRCVYQTPWEDSEEMSLPLSFASIGLAMYAMHMTDAKSWLESADQACFEAKRQGRARLQQGSQPSLSL
jgi:PleD family two-component response regulator